MEPHKVKRGNCVSFEGKYIYQSDIGFKTVLIGTLLTDGTVTYKETNLKLKK